jgi:hypothetical protein
VLTATRVALPATKSISSLVSCRTAIPKNVSLSVSRSFTTSQVAHNESDVDASSAAPTDTTSDTVIAANNESEDVTTASTDAASDTVIAANNESEDAATALTDAASDTVIAANNESEDVSTRAVPTDAPSDVISAVFPPKNESEDGTSGAAHEANNTIFVGNVPYKATEEDIRSAFTGFDKIERVRLRTFFFPDRFFNGVFIRTTPLDVNVRGRSRGTAHVEFASKDQAVAAMNSINEKPIQMSGRYLRIENSFGNQKPVNEPNEFLYFSNCSGGVSEIRTVFQEFNDSIIDLFLCMLFILSNSVPTTHMG